MQKVPLWNARPEAVPRNELRAQALLPPRRTAGGFRADLPLARAQSASPRSFGSASRRARGSPVGRPLPWASPTTGMRHPVSYRSLIPEPDKAEGIGSAHAIALQHQYQLAIEEQEAARQKAQIQNSQKLEISQRISARKIAVREQEQEAQRLAEERQIFQKELAREQRVEHERKVKQEKELRSEEQRRVRIRRAIEKTQSIRQVVQEHQEHQKEMRENLLAQEEEKREARKEVLRQQGKSRLEAKRLRERIVVDQKREKEAAAAAKRGQWPVKTRVVHERIEACEQRIAAAAAVMARRQEQFVIDRQRRRLVRDYDREMVRRQEEHDHAVKMDAAQKRADERERKELAVELRHQRLVDECFLRSELVHQAWEERERQQRMEGPMTARLDVRG